MSRGAGVTGLLDLGGQAGEHLTSLQAIGSHKRLDSVGTFVTGNRSQR
jgi:hypothetical protein